MASEKNKHSETFKIPGVCHTMICGEEKCECIIPEKFEYAVTEDVIRQFVKEKMGKEACKNELGDCTSNLQDCKTRPAETKVIVTNEIPNWVWYVFAAVAVVTLVGGGYAGYKLGQL